MTNLPCECQEPKPKGETNSSFLVLHPLSDVHTVKTVGSHLYVLQGKTNKYAVLLTLIRNERFAFVVFSERGSP